MATYRGSCHCGRIRLEAEGELDEVSVCNCSICHRTGYLHWTVPPAAFRLVTGEGEYATYEFGTGVAKHYFCRTCGISPFRVARSEPDRIDVNVRCLEGVEVESLPVSRFDGQNWEQEMERRGLR